MNVSEFLQPNLNIGFFWGFEFALEME
jgi:hypothetical protein